MVALRIALVFGVLTLASQVFAQTVIYPAKGQTAAQQSKDEGECQVWAKQNTGSTRSRSPRQASQPVAAPPPEGKNQRLKGAAVGAAGGAAVGAVSGGDAGKGAAAGAVAGTAVGGHQKRKAARDSKPPVSKRRPHSRRTCRPSSRPSTRRTRPASRGAATA